MFDFSEQVVVISGASGALGRAVTRAFEGAGARLVLVERRLERLHEAFPDLIEADCCLMAGADVTSAEDIKGMVEAAAARFGHIDILVNIVGGFRAGLPLHETPVETWHFLMNLNALSVFLMSQGIIPQMLQQGRGKIISIGARPGLQGRAGMAAYSAAKGAVIRLTESMAAELRGEGINVNCIIPGTIDTPANRQEMPEADPSLWVAPEAIADVIMFLASDAARAIHGAVVPVYGLT